MRNLLSGLVLNANLDVAFARNLAPSSGAQQLVLPQRLAEPAEGEAGNSHVPAVLGPLDGTTWTGSTVTLSFQPLAGYTGNYYVRLHDEQWDGRQAVGFRHDATAHYLCLSTKQTSITVPVRAGHTYRWWVHKPGFPAAGARFNVAAPIPTGAPVTPPPPSVAPDVPVLLSPATDSVVSAGTVTLNFQPTAGYTGNYYVRLHDEQWDGRQAVGFRHDATAHYLCLLTKQTSITVPVRAGHTYRWWVHQAGDAAASAARFSVAATAPADPVVTPPPPASSPHVPVLLTPATGSTIDTASVALTFQPPAGYTGNYYVRLHDEQWDGRQAAGFQHDATAHYLCLLTKQTSITVPVRAGHTYRWWVHKAGYAATPAATFAVSGTSAGSLPVTPGVDQLFDLELIGGRYRATAMQAWSNQNIDVSGALQRWVDALPVGATLELPAGKYSVSNQIVINRRITLTSVGKHLGDPRCDASAGDCAELIASAALNQPNGILQINQLAALHHIILNGNKEGRAGSLAYQMVASGQSNRPGITARLSASDCVIEGNVFKNALGGTGLEVTGGLERVDIRGNLFANNGVHTARNLWADGLTVHDLRDSRVENNQFIDNTDIDLIFGGARNCVIRGNQILHTSNRAGGAFAGLMIHKWSTTSGDYTGVDISDNVIDGGPNRDIGSGIYVASEGWYDQTP
ncbi:MAG: right-handed parallel beta-helix repeat-containing protein, partial [Planctomycetes bacterium]|nr:right-handed parallel beta-helix repeat-containing protein [Planctomycetota bacterium]